MQEQRAREDRRTDGAVTDAAVTASVTHIFTTFCVFCVCLLSCVLCCCHELSSPSETKERRREKEIRKHHQHRSDADVSCAIFNQNHKSIRTALLKPDTRK